LSPGSTGHAADAVKLDDLIPSGITALAASLRPICRIKPGSLSENRLPVLPGLQFFQASSFLVRAGAMNNKLGVGNLSREFGAER
jgi:hypothetical protein